MDAILQERWEQGCVRPIRELEQRTFTTMRNMGIDESIQISDLIATRLDYKTVCREPLHIILGVVSDRYLETRIEVGGSPIGCDKIVMAPDVPTRILVHNGYHWPLPIAEYHEIKLVDVPNDANVWVLGVRVNTEIYRLLMKPMCIPELLWLMHKSMYLTKAPKDIIEFTELPKIDLHKP